MLSGVLAAQHNLDPESYEGTRLLALIVGGVIFWGFYVLKDKRIESKRANLRNEIDARIEAERAKRPASSLPTEVRVRLSGGEVRDLWITPKGDTTKSHKPDQAAINQHATLNPVKKMDAGPEDIEREVDVKLE